MICKCEGMSFRKGTLGVKRTTINWATLRECGHKPLQFYWFRSVVKLYNSMLKSKSQMLSRLLKADLSIHSRDPSCWNAFLGLRCISRVAALRFICASSAAGYFHFYSRVQGRTVWRDVEGLNPQNANGKLATYQSLFAVPFNLNVRAPSSFMQK